MSVSLMRLVWLVEWPTQPMRGVAMKLADCANDEGENIYPSVGRIERETGWSEAAVRQAIAALEQAGVLEVVSEATGNRLGRSTTVRRLRPDLLAALATTDHHNGTFTPSAALLKAVAEGRKRRWVIARRGAKDVSAYDALAPAGYARTPVPEDSQGDGTAGEQTGSPLQEVEGQSVPGCTRAPPCGGGDPSTSWTPPLQEVDPNHHRTTSEGSPLPPHGGVSGNDASALDKGAHLGRRWTKARGYLAEVRAGLKAAVVVEVIDRLGGVLGPPKGANPEQYARQVVFLLGGYPAGVLRQVADRVERERKTHLPPAHELRREAERIAAEAKAAAAAHAEAAALAAAQGDPAATARWATAWDRTRRALEGRIGTEAVNSWFRAVLVAGLDNGTLTLRAPMKFMASYIRQHFLEQVCLDAAAAFAPEPVKRVEVVYVKAAAQLLLGASDAHGASAPAIRHAGSEVGAQFVAAPGAQRAPEGASKERR